MSGITTQMSSLLHFLVYFCLFFLGNTKNAMYYIENNTFCFRDMSPDRLG